MTPPLAAWDATPETAGRGPAGANSRDNRPGLPVASRRCVKSIHATVLVALAACAGDGHEPVSLDKRLDDPGPEPDAIYTGGRIYTADPRHPTATAMAVREGRIVGFDDEVATWLQRMEFPRQRVHPLGGRAVIPGFVDAHNHVFQRIERMELEDSDGIHAALRGLEDRLLAHGITAQGLLSVGRGLLSDLDEYDHSQGFRIRTSVYMNYNGVCDRVSSAYYLTEEPISDPTLRLRVPGIKVFADGGHCAYTDETGYHEKWPALSYPGYTRHTPADGDAYLDGDELRSLIRTAEQRGWQLAVHTIGDRARTEVLTAFDLQLEGRNRLHHRLEHNTVIRPDQITAYGATGVVPVVWGRESTCLEAALDPDASWRATLGSSRWSWYRPWADMVAAFENMDMRLAWHTDVLMTTAIDSSQWNPMAHFHGFVTRAERDADGHRCLPTPDLATQRLSRARALKTMTIDSAYALGLDGVTGSLEVGKYADFVVLSADLMTAPEDTLDRIRTLATFVEGDPVYCHPDAGGACLPTL